MPDFTRRSFNGGEPSLPEINQTDRFLDALSTEQPVYSNDSGEAELAYLLAGWRDEVRQPPMASVVTPRDAAIALDRATTTTARRRFSLAVVGSVAAAVLCLGGFGSVVYGAGPGDPLYGVRTMLFGEQTTTRDDQVALAAQTQMAEVQQLIEQGEWTAAQDKLQTLTTTVAAVGDTSRQQELVDQWQQLSVKVETRDPDATVPPNAPPVVLPEVPSDLPLPALLSPDATPPSDSTAPATTPPSSTDPSVPPTTTPPASSTPPPSTSSPPVPSATSPTAPTLAPSSPASAPPVTTTPRAPVELPPSSAPVTTTMPTTSLAPTTVAPATTVAPPVAESEVEASEVEVEAPTKPAPTVERPEAVAPVVTTTVLLPLPGDAADAAAEE
ncbi:hypothetical protein AU196_06110 [Mycobacterium sp. IS-1742]|uniref:anti-sigma-D factor RsdA n=1 Tax=Mycobacterium sp. IS-1742 TaxID=1772285 RepID=UPI0007404DBE|nr:anti-sigma-D factor RsdA [Mycobacterium sp. IS-1742]KUI30172.1 hypothetical protein AU196_06110 [Mycobacterium sp. IS-1742]